MIIQADARRIPLVDGCVQTVITSPPYWGLRDYGHGDQLGLEASPQAFAAALVAVFDEVRRVLRDDGTVWLNIGDSYASTPVGRFNGGGFTDASAISGGRDMSGHATSGSMDKVKASGLRAKNLVGIPWRVAFALQDAGWYVRNDIIWNKPNPMPSSASDRLTVAHEYIFLLTKSERYYFDAEAIAEPLGQASIDRYTAAITRREKYDPTRHKSGPQNEARHMRAPMEILTGSAAAVVERGTRNKRTVWTVPTSRYAGAHHATFPEQLIEPMVLAGAPLAGRRCDCDEVIATPLGDDAIEDPTLLTGRAGFNRPRLEGQGTRPMTRREQKGYAKQLKASPHRVAMEAEAGSTTFEHYIRTDLTGGRAIPPALLTMWRERGWLVDVEPCDHPVEPAGIVFDPFLGSGTVGAVASRLGRRWVGTDLSYQELSWARTAQRGILFEEAR